MPAIITIQSLVGGSPVTEDIVTRLRGKHGLWFLSVGVNESIIFETIYGEAADEIERLRRQIQLMAIDYRTQIHGLKSRCQCGAANA